MSDHSSQQQIGQAVADCARALVLYNTRLEQLADKVSAIVTTQSQSAYQEQHSQLERFLQDALKQQQTTEAILRQSIIAASESFAAATGSSLSSLHAGLAEERSNWTHTVSEADERLSETLEKTAEKLSMALQNKADSTLVVLREQGRDGVRQARDTLHASRHADRWRWRGLYLLHVVALGLLGFMIWKSKLAG